MNRRWVYEGHGHRLEATMGAGGLGRLTFHLDGRPLGPPRVVLVSHRVSFTTTEKGRTVPWTLEARGGYTIQVRVWRDGHIVNGWS